MKACDANSSLEYTPLSLWNGWICGAENGNVGVVWALTRATGIDTGNVNSKRRMRNGTRRRGRVDPIHNRIMNIHRRFVHAGGNVCARTHTHTRTPERQTILGYTKGMILVPRAAARIYITFRSCCNPLFVSRRCLLFLAARRTGTRNTYNLRAAYIGGRQKQKERSACRCFVAFPRELIYQFTKTSSKQNICCAQK